MTPSLLLAAALSAPAADTAPKADILASLAGAGNYKTLVNLLVATDLADALKAGGPYTVLAPSDEAFGKLPKKALADLLRPENRDQLKAVLLYHVVPKKNGFNVSNGEPGRDYPFATLNGAKVVVRVDGDAFTVNGVRTRGQTVGLPNGAFVALDGVLLPPAKGEATSDAEPAARNTIPAVAKKAGMFKTLLAALSAAELAEVLDGDGPFTVFAPTDEAFAKLGGDTVKSLLKPENRRRLVAVLKYHVVAGKVSAQQAAAAGTARTLQGGAVKVTIKDGRLTINQSGVVKSDVAADNGVIHVIDAVLTPPGH
ncbi:MAG: fasciclin domain-containing protein [Gemmataceae bacterium]|nr:fasciclin domain-containing protein [Gemmataceae bacterium]